MMSLGWQDSTLLYSEGNNSWISAFLSTIELTVIKLFACWVIFMLLLSSATLFQNYLFQKILSETLSECQTVWIQTRTHNVSPDLGPNCLQRLSADGRVKELIYHFDFIKLTMFWTTWPLCFIWRQYFIKLTMFWTTCPLCFIWRQC